MRDTNDDMIELLDVSSKDNVYSCLIRHKINNEHLKLRFGIEVSDYPLLKAILQFRPFENTGVAKYHYYFVLSYRFDPDNENLVCVAVRVEQLKNHKQFELRVSKKYLANILWFKTLEDKNQVEAMIEA